MNVYRLAALMALVGIGIASAAEPFPASPVRQLFSRMDANHDGRITPEEWGRFAKDSADLPLDLDGDGSLSEPEFEETLRLVKPVALVSVRLVVDQLLDRGNALMKAGRFDDALAAFNSAENSGKDSIPAVLAASDCLVKLGSLFRAAGKLVAALERFPNSLEMWLTLAAVRRRMGDHEAARGALLRAKGLLSFAVAVPDRAAPGGTGTSPLGQSMLEALALAAAAFGPKSSEMCELSAVVDKQRLKTEDALPRAARFICRAQDLVRDREYDKALSLSESEIRAHGNDWQPRLLSAALLGGRGKPGDGLARLQTAVHLGAPTALVAPVRAGLLLDLGERAEALASLPRTDSPTCPVSAIFDTAWQLAGRGEWKLATPYLERCVKGFYRLSLSVLLLVVDHWKQGEVMIARRLFEQPPSTLELEVDEQRLLMRLAEGIGRTKELVPILEESVKRRPDAGTWFCLARAYQLLGNQTARTGSLQKAAALAPAGTPLRRAVERELSQK